MPQFATGCVYTPPAINTTISFDSEGGSAVPSQTVTDGATVTEPTPPTRTGYDFDRWYICADATQAKFDFATPITGDIKLCAKWNPVSGEPNAGFGFALRSPFIVAVVGLLIAATVILMRKFAKR